MILADAFSGPVTLALMNPTFHSEVSFQCLIEYLVWPLYRCTMAAPDPDNIFCRRSIFKPTSLR